MTHVFGPWYYVLRGLALRSPVGLRTPPEPVPTPEGFDVPAPLPDDENGYLRFASHVAQWPSEGHPAPDLNHRRMVLPNDRQAAERALRPLRPLFEEVDLILSMRRWQVPIPKDQQWPELRPIRRLGHALLLRGALDGRKDDLERVLEIARKLQGSQSPLLHFLVGIGLEKSADGPFEGLRQARRETVRWELARVIVPSAHLAGPWEPETLELPPVWRDDVKTIRYLLAKHPLPYDPAATVAMLLQDHDLMASGSAAEIRKRATAIGAGWPDEMHSVLGHPITIPLVTVYQSHDAVQSLENPYGRLSVARTLHAMAAVADAVEKNLTPQSAGGDAPPRLSEAS